MGPSDGLAHRARTMIAAEPPVRVPVSELARQLGCSTSHLSRTFTRVFGMTPTTYRTEVRLQLAIEHLRTTPGADLTQVALSCGFSSHSHFTAAFRRRIGLTPSAFAARMLSVPERTPASAGPCGTYSR